MFDHAKLSLTADEFMNAFLSDFRYEPKVIKSIISIYVMYAYVAIKVLSFQNNFLNFSCT